jgi:hypothetical protein
MRTSLDEEMEKTFSSASSVGQVRALAEKNPRIENYVKDSDEPVKILLET